MILLSCRRRPPTTMTTVVSSMIVNAAKAAALIPRRRYNDTNNNNTIMPPIIIIGPLSSFHHRRRHHHPLVKQSSFTFPGGRRWFASPSATNNTGGVTKSTMLVDFNNSDDDDDDDDDEGWLPPDDSPLAVNTMNKTMRTKLRSPPSRASSEEEGAEEPLSVSSSLRLTEQRRQQQRQYENNDDDDENDDEEEFILPSENSIIEVIDIEATLANEHNQQLLKHSVGSSGTKDNDGGGEESSLLLRRGSVKHSSSRSTKDDDNNDSSGVSLSSREEIMGEEEDEEFQVQLSDIDSWGDILQELYDTKQMDVIHRLVKEYNLHTLYESIVAAAAQDSSASTAATSSTTNDTVVKRMNNPNSTRDDEEDDNSNDNDDDEELVYDEEFIMSLRGLTKDEIINELIEYSPSLTQLEMEIISSEMSKNRSLLRTKDDDDDDDDSLDLNTIPELNEFRSMVLDDYYQELKKMKQQHGEHQMTTDWKDFDTRVALQNDFATSDIIDNNNIHDKEGVLEPPTTSSMVVDDTLDSTIDWLHARRLRLGGDTNNNSKSNSSPNKDNNNSSNTTPTQLLTPGQAEVFQHQNSHIPVHMYTLFTTSELSMSLLAQGGTDIHIINTSSNHPQHVNSTGGGGVGIGCDYILLCTGRNPAHIRTLADSIVRNLKLRKLNERNVLGAMHGIEGGQDIFSNKRSRNRARKLGGGGGPGSSGRMDDDWIVIDCDNIHVHILDDVTRKCLNIESLWDLSNPNSEGSKLRRINLSDDDEMDEYVTQNPIPDEYAVKLFNYSSSSKDGGRGRDGWFTGGAGSRVQTVLSSYNRKSFSDKWNGKGSSSSNSSSGKKGRRSQRAKSVR